MNQLERKMIDVSVIVVCFRGWARLRKCLDSLAAFRGETFSFEVIVVDNNSGDRVIHDFERKYPDFRFILNPVNGGYANGNNLGCRNASGEYVLVLNPDTEASENEIARMLDEARAHPEFSIISCRQVNDRGKETPCTGDFPEFANLTGFQRSVSRIFRKSAAAATDTDQVMFPDWVSGSVVWMKRDLYLQLGGFYEGFWMYYEDVDICRRINREKGKVVRLNNVTVIHNHGGSSRVNKKTASITKTEVHISRHLYVSRNIKGAEGAFIQIFLVANNIISGAIMAAAGLIFFFVPALFLRTTIFFRLMGYYAGAALRRSWIGPRSVLYPGRMLKKAN